MVDHAAIDAEVQARIEEARLRIDGQTEGHKRWNRLEEAMDTACEDAINLLDDVGRVQQATEISSMLAAHERYDALLAILRDDRALAQEAESADVTEHDVRSRRWFEGLARLAESEKRHRPF